MDDDAVRVRDALRAGTRVGPYTIRAPLREEKTGSVFLAEQDGSERRVALKMLDAVAFTPTALARFRYEAHALTSLRHPGIAWVFETGIHAVEEGAVLHEIPWLATEHVADAHPLLEFADAARLDRSARLQLFLEVCDAVHHGHQKGVVHGDLDAGKILVGAAGAPKVIDFGVARALKPGGDVRTDVHALGVVLADLVAVPAHGDLATILATARESDVTRRYASANALAADLRRFLAHRPIEARAGSMIYPMRLFARRHPFVVGAIAALVILSVAAAAIAIVVALRAEGELRELRRELDATKSD